MLLRQAFCFIALLSIIYFDDAICFAFHFLSSPDDAADFAAHFHYLFHLIISCQAFSFRERALAAMPSDIFAAARRHAATGWPPQRLVRLLIFDARVLHNTQAAFISSFHADSSPRRRFAAT